MKKLLIKVALFHYTKIDNDIIRCMQNLINEIEYGKYDNKKTQSDRIQDIIQQKQLTSYMNKTKWQELIAEIRQIDNLLIKYKTIFDTSDPDIYWTIDGDEHFDFMNKALIEWFIISGNITLTNDSGTIVSTIEIGAFFACDKLNEVTFKGTKGAQARVVFDGTVSTVFYHNDYACVLVRHGKYISVYCNLEGIRVKSGDTLKTGDIIGDIAADVEDGNPSMLFQLYREKTLLNPSDWLKL